MAKIRIPDSLKKKDMVYGGKTPADELISSGDDFLAADRLAEALDFFVAAKDKDRIQAIAARAVDEGDLFLFMASMKALGEKIPGENGTHAGELEKLAGNAEAAGKLSFAEKARAILSGEVEADGEGEETESGPIEDDGSSNKADKPRKRRKKR